MQYTNIEVMLISLRARRDAAIAKETTALSTARQNRLHEERMLCEAQIKALQAAKELEEE